jgi:membrane-associated protease RseP (regulator of RpoE activity)
MMIHKPVIAVFAGLFVVSWLVADSQNSNAQLFPRLRERIQARSSPPTNIPPTNIPPTNLRRANNLPPRVPQYSPSPDAQPGALRPGGLRPRRVPPVKPAGPTSDDPDPDQNSQDSQSSLGASILDSTDDANQTGTGSPADKPAPAGKPALGIQVVESRAQVAGLEVKQIYPASQAGSAGLEVGDVILAIDGKATKKTAQINAVLASRQVGEKVRLQVLRDGDTTAIMVPLIGSSAPTKATALQPSASTLGLQFANAPRQQGVVITEIEPDSPAFLAGLRTGDRIVSVNGRLLVDSAAWEQAWSRTAAEATIELGMVRNGKLLSAKLDPQATADDHALAAGNQTGNARQNNPLGGLGAMIGGLFSARGNTNPSQSEPPTSESPAPATVAGEAAKIAGEPAKSAREVEQVDFESEPAEETDPLALDADPLSLDDSAEELLPPKKQPQLTPAQRQAEIERLRQRLQELEESDQ